MTLREIAHAVADETVGPRPTRIAGNAAPDARNLLRTINKVGAQLVREHAWSFLLKQYTFQASGQLLSLPAAEFPADFSRLLSGTFQLIDSNIGIRGPALPVEWATFDSDSGPPLFFRSAEGIQIRPVPSAGEPLAFWYVSKTWVRAGGSHAPRATMTDDDDIPMFDQELVVLFAKSVWLQDMDRIGDRRQQQRIMRCNRQSATTRSRPAACSRPMCLRVAP